MSLVGKTDSGHHGLFLTYLIIYNFFIQLKEHRYQIFNSYTHLQQHILPSNSVQFQFNLLFFHISQDTQSKNIHSHCRKSLMGSINKYFMIMITDIIQCPMCAAYTLTHLTLFSCPSFTDTSKTSVTCKQYMGIPSITCVDNRTLLMYKPARTLLIKDYANSLTNTMSEDQQGVLLVSAS